jgi:ABC-type nitrate/sulfonate/bicarbonate transport system permease component
LPRTAFRRRPERAPSSFPGAPACAASSRRGSGSTSVWLGLGLGARVLVIFLFAVFEPLLNSYAGAKSVDPLLVDVARTFGAGRRDLGRKVVLPASLPFVLTGLRMAASRAVKGMILAEMLFSVTGHGGLLIRYAGQFRIDRVLVVIVTVALLGVALTGAVQAVERAALRWRATS